MICSYCSSEMPAISAFCPGCGRSADSSSETVSSEPRAAGFGEALAGSLAYFALLPALLFLGLPSFRARRFLRFHSWQSVLFVITTLAIAALTRAIFALLAIIPGMGFLFAVLLAGVVALALVMIWCVLVLKALQGRTYELPWLGRWATLLTG